MSLSIIPVVLGCVVGRQSRMFVEKFCLHLLQSIFDNHNSYLFFYARTGTAVGFGLILSKILFVPLPQIHRSTSRVTARNKKTKHNSCLQKKNWDIFLNRLQVVKVYTLQARWLIIKCFHNLFFLLLTYRNC